MHEAVYILDGLIRNGSEIQPDTIHGDTQAQCGPVFGPSHLLGINLMPRMRNIEDLVLYKADKRRKYMHIESLSMSSATEWVAAGRWCMNRGEDELRYLMWNTMKCAHHTECGRPATTRRRERAKVGEGPHRGRRLYFRRRHRFRVEYADRSGNGGSKPCD